MANPVTHILVPMIILEVYRRYFAKKKFSKWYVFLAGFIGPAPDYDFIAGWLLKGSDFTGYHRGLTHTLFIPLLLTAIGLLIFFLKKSKTLKSEGWRTTYSILFTASIGFATHTMLDAIDHLYYWFYPLKIGISLPPLIGTKFRVAILDGALLLFWLLYQEDMLKDIKKFLLRIKFW